jgi:hypothetical protein
MYQWKWFPSIGFRALRSTRKFSRVGRFADDEAEARRAEACREEDGYCECRREEEGEMEDEGEEGVDSNLSAWTSCRR